MAEYKSLWHGIGLPECKRMKDENDTLTGSENGPLRGLLQAARPAPALPPRFRQEVWRRIERAEVAREAPSGSWLEALVGRLVRPRLLLASLAVLVVVSGTAGAVDRSRAARASARAQYLSAVAPHTVP